MATATYTPISTQTLGSAAASITFSSIPGTYTDLRLVLTCTTSVADIVAMNFNSDAGINYSSCYIYGTGATASGGSFTGRSLCFLHGNGVTSTTVPSNFEADIFSYAGSTNKTYLATAGLDFNGSGTVELTCGLWRSTAAITNIKLSLNNANNFSTGTIATLFGI